MIHQEISTSRDPPRTTKSPAFFYLFELPGLLLAERFYPPTVVFGPFDPPPPRMASRDNTIVVALPPGSPRRIHSKEDAKAANSENSAHRNIPRIRQLASNDHSHEDSDEDEVDWEKDNDDEPTLPRIHNHSDSRYNSLAARHREREREHEKIRAELLARMEADEEADDRREEEEDEDEEEEEEDRTRRLRAENPFAAPVRHGGAGHRGRDSDARRDVLGLTARNPFASS
ncbi:hypothetical protein RSOLAG22IIIB_06654 [Rhizoctonia solani]|uniref:Uncharacterized protein n=1 Tax=Rhizoctonia solani TaxID=456999 RepID=A0A0K6GFQ5_9AGAM|nr:hypothetical protein RSOLAG22IIIB_06654 [Rhizoctonia solani]